MRLNLLIEEKSVSTWSFFHVLITLPQKKVVRIFRLFDFLNNLYLWPLSLPCCLCHSLSIVVPLTILSYFFYLNPSILFLKLLQQTIAFCCQLKTFLFQSAFWHRENWWLLCDLTLPFGMLNKYLCYQLLLKWLYYSWLQGPFIGLSTILGLCWPWSILSSSIACDT